MSLFPTPRGSNPFETGFRHGFATGQYVANRQVAELYPDYTSEQIDHYQNGRDDGIAGDTWRIRQVIADSLGKAA